ncbi:MAG: RecQ family ATP-dependent DNA helicase [Bacteroidia bacterium]|nr:RecQ family ATP-dependent DNA helicase [Bacteroidia bacterium]
MHYREAALQVLQEFWGYPQFRPLQDEIIAAVLNKQDVLTILPTGGGKSICFQIPGILLKGTTIVISPLIALMKDQVQNLLNRNIAATYINSSLNRTEIESRLVGCVNGSFKFLYCAPERLLTPLFLEYLPYLNSSLLAIDEAHCISQWGHDFRPAYLKIADFRKLIPNVPCIALTATATPKVQEDIVQRLELKQYLKFQQSFVRKNLSFSVLYDENKLRRIIEILQRVQGSAIVYARARKTCEELQHYLNQYGISAQAYHAGLSPKQRNEVQQAWITNDTRVVVATNAFGMGIDKPDVRLVLHYHAPPDLENYYQEAGRAGRDGQKAFAICFSISADKLYTQQQCQDSHPEWDFVLQTYNLICDMNSIFPGEYPERTFPLKLNRWAELLKTSPAKVLAAIQILEHEELVQLFLEPEKNAYFQFTCTPQELLSFKEKHFTIAEKIDWLLRLYGGILFQGTQSIDLQYFVDSVSFERNSLLQTKQGATLTPDEELWCERNKMPWTAADWEKMLLYCSQYGIAEYRPASGEPSFALSTSRRQFSTQNPNQLKYKFLLEQANQRLNAILNYIDTKNICRNQLICSYFGEMNSEPCGICDACLGRHTGFVGSVIFQKICSEVSILLKQNPLRYDALLQSIKTGTRPQQEQTIRVLLDNGTLYNDSNFYLHCK